MCYKTLPLTVYDCVHIVGSQNTTGICQHMPERATIKPNFLRQNKHPSRKLWQSDRTLKITDMCMLSTTKTTHTTDNIFSPTEGF